MLFVAKFRHGQGAYPFPAEELHPLSSGNATDMISHRSNLQPTTDKFNHRNPARKPWALALGGMAVLSLQFVRCSA